MVLRKGSKPSVSWGKSSRFKGIERLLRRISYNLGNTPSKTDVKIVSCIPIDVTDLQIRIFTLEKQLENARRQLQPRRPPRSSGPGVRIPRECLCPKEPPRPSSPRSRSPPRASNPRPPSPPRPSSPRPRSPPPCSSPGSRSPPRSSSPRPRSPPPSSSPCSRSPPRSSSPRPRSPPRSESPKPHSSPWPSNHKAIECNLSWSSHPRPRSYSRLGCQFYRSPYTQEAPYVPDTDPSEPYRALQNPTAAGPHDPAAPGATGPDDPAASNPEAGAADASEGKNEPCKWSPLHSLAPINVKTWLKSWNQPFTHGTDDDEDPLNGVVIKRVEASIIPNYARTQSRLSETSLRFRKKKHEFSAYSQDDAQYNVKSSSRHAVQEKKNIYGRVISDRDRTRLVYYAQTAGSPFTNYKKAKDTSKDNSGQAMHREYLSSLLERQHHMKMYLDEDTLGSQGSVPVCSGTSDDTGSCHGIYLDVDCNIRKRHVYDPNIDHGDSNLYDVKPVKESKPVKRRKPIKNSALVEKQTSEVDCTFLSEYYRFMPEYCLNNLMAHKPNEKRERRAKSLYLPNDLSETDGVNSHIYPKRLLPKQELGYTKNECVSRNAECNASSECSDRSEFCIKPIHTFSVTKPTRTSDYFSKSPSASVECSQTLDYAKCFIGQIKARQTCLSTQKTTFKNAACLALPVNDAECQTDSLNNASYSSTPPDKTEPTLSDIKSMLETVLTEVKTNSGTGTIIDEKEAKGATVPKEHGPVSECERLLSGFTYCPCSIYNPYIPSCSHALPSCCSSMMQQTLTIPRHEKPLTDMSNFPKTVHHTDAAHSCFPDRNAMQPKQISTCGTNTLHDPSTRNTETDDLIKEIYKTIKLDVDYSVNIASCNAVYESKANDVCKASPEGITTLGSEEIACRGDVGTSRASRFGRRSSHSSLTKPHRRGTLHQQLRHTISAQRRQDTSQGTNKDSLGSDSDGASDVNILHSATPAELLMKPAKDFFDKVMSSVVMRMRKKEEQPQTPEKRTSAATQDSESSDFKTPIIPEDSPVKSVSYAPAAPQTWREGESARPMTSTSRTRRLGKPGQTQRMPRYIPPRPRSSVIRRTLYRPQPPNLPRTPPEYTKCPTLPHNQYDWRTTLTKSVHRMAPISVNEYKSRIPVKRPGIKTTNKT